MTTDLSENYHIRAAAAQDLPAVLDLLQPYVDRRVLLKRSREEMAVLLQTGFVASYSTHAATVYDGEIVGFSSVEIYSRKLSEIQCLVVHEDHRRYGLGRHLVQQCIELARQRGVMEVMAISSSEQFLHELGFDYSLPDQKRALFYQLRSRYE